jgi:restriction system protein
LIAFLNSGNKFAEYAPTGHNYKDHMAKKQESNPFSLLLELMSLLPWWAGVSAAVISYFVLHALAKPAVATAVDVQNIGAFVTGALWRSIAHVGQYLVPPVCLMGAAASAWKRYERKKLIGDAVQSDTADALADMTWQEFEMLVGEAFRLDGFRVEERGGASADGGVDLVLRKDSEKFLVQCKQWRAFKVGVSVVRELYGVMAATGAAGGFVVTSGTFTYDAIKFAEGRNVILVDGPILFDMIKQARSGAPSST